MDLTSMIDALQAPGSHPDLAEKLMLFGQFVGTWDVDVFNIAPDSSRKALKGEWHFGWALEERAIDLSNCITLFSGNVIISSLYVRSIQMFGSG
jgi:hypothetical protein